MEVKCKGDLLYYRRDATLKVAPVTTQNIKKLQRLGYDCTKVLTLNGRLTLPLYPYQFEGVLHARKKQWNLLIADSVGVGKTLSAIGCMAMGKPKKTVIVVPAPLKYQWERNLRTALPDCGHIYICNGQNFEMCDVLWIRHSDIVIINYNIVDYWVDLLVEHDWDLMILDEAHRVKHPTTAVSKAVAKLREKCKSCLCLSGTPLTDRNSDIWNVIRMVDPTLFPNHFIFQQRYCGGISDPGGGSSQSTNMLELHSRLVDTGTMIRRTKQDVYDELPKVETNVVPLGVTSDTLCRLVEETKAETAWMQSQNGKDRSMHAFKAHQSLEKYLQEAIRLKLPLAIDWIRDFLNSTNEKLVVGVVHREKCGDILYGKFADIAVHIDGSADAKKKDKLLTEFINSPEKRLLIGNIQSVGTGIDGLQRVCSNMVIIELPWSVADITQMIARLDRNGQTQPVSVTFLVVKDSIDDMLIRMLDRKKKITGEVLDGTTPAITETLAYMLNSKDI